MPRLLLDARTVQARRGGIGRMVEGLVRALVRIAPELEIFLVAGRYRAGQLSAAGPRVRDVYADAGTIDLEFEAKQLPALIEELRPDAYHATCFALPAQRLACRTVVTIHDACVRRAPDFVRPGLREVIDRATVQALGSADAVVTVSEFSRDEIAAAYGFPRERIEVISNGVEESFFAPPDPEVERRMNLPKHFWLVVGAEESRKGLHVALGGFKLYTMESPQEIRPMLVCGARGGGRHMTADDMAAELGIDSGARRLGYVAEEELRVLYHRASGVLYLSLYEGFGLPALEAMAAGAPTVVASGSSLPEVVGDAALIVPPRDIRAVAEALHRLQTDPDLCARLRATGPARARRFSWDAAARKYLELYGIRADRSEIPTDRSL